MPYEKPWTGEPLKGECLGWDTETTVVDLSREIPELCVLSAHDGERTVLVGPRQVEEFVEKHLDTLTDRHWCGLNTPFDWWVVYQHLKDPLLKKWWVNSLDAGNLAHDVSALDQLLRLAEGRDMEPFYQRGMRDLAKEYLSEDVEKDGGLRMGFTPDMFEDEERYPKTWSGWAYSANDARVTFDLWNVIAERARQASSRIPAGVRPEVGMGGRVGLLSEGLQVRSAVTLSRITRTGFAVNTSLASEKLREGNERANEALKRLAWCVPGLVKTDKKGNIKRTTKSGLPSMNAKLLRAEFVKAAKVLDITPPMSEKAGFVTTAAEWWKENAPSHPMVDAWVAFQEESKTLQLLGNLQGLAEVHSQYHNIKRTGRTSASDINIQQIPRDSWFRSLFIARPGHALVTLDFSFIELRTLAAILESRFGGSRLAETIRSGKCPHSNTAAMVRQIPYESFVASLKAEKAAVKAAESSGLPKPGTPFSKDRQAAKAINFGVPGGLGAAKLAAYARSSYGVDMDLGTARELRDKLITEVYPELTEWLADDITCRLHWSLGCTRANATRFLGEVSKWGDPTESPVARVVRGDLYRSDGRALSDHYVDSVWTGIEALITKRTPGELARLIRDRRSGADLHRQLFVIPAVTVAGRSRLKTFYGDFRNTQFQGSAADGAKLGLWELMKHEYRVVAFIHDEIVCEVPLGPSDPDGTVAARDIERICVSAFESVMPGGFPIGCEWAVGPTWSKG